jgi:hypothetical protein
MSECIKYPSIEQFRNVIRAVQMRARFVGKDENGDAIYDNVKPLPKIEFEGTVKLHGTNASFVYDCAEDGFTYQSRERVLTLTQDNAGFMLYMMKHEDKLREIVQHFAGVYEMTSNTDQEYMPVKYVVAGEFCGQGIQKSVAISELPKMFVIFGVKAIHEDGTVNWVDISADWQDSVHEDIKIYNIHQFPTFPITIDFERPEIAQNQMIKWVEEVEAECPVGKYFDVSGIGEGIVFKPKTTGWFSSDFYFKVKGEKHSVSKVKTLASINIELMESQQAWVDSVCTENRLEQMLDNLQREKLLPFEMTSLGDFIRSVVADIYKEHQDEVIEHQFDPKKLNPLISKVSRNWYMNKFNSLVGV